MAKKDNGSTTALVEKETTALSADLAATLVADAGAGMDNISMDECSLPFIGLVQANSDILKSKESLYNPDAKVGQIYDNVSGDVNDKILVSFASFRKTYVEWTPGTKGTFVAEHAPDSDVVANASTVESVENGFPVKRLVTASGNILNETYSYVLTYKDSKGNIKAGILPMKKTMIAIARRLNTLIRSTKEIINGQKLTPPMYAMQFEMSSAMKSNDKGDWYVPKFDYKGLITDSEFFAAARDLFEVAKTKNITGVTTDDDDLV